MTAGQRFLKRAFDITAATFGIVITAPIMASACLIAWAETGRSGIFQQNRVGQHGKIFRVLKIRTMRDISGRLTTVTTDRDPRITTLGRVFRKLKIDELPQFFNVLRGDMSFVGPRPDVPEQMAVLTAEEKRILSVRPGITGPASLKYRYEEKILARQPDAEAYNAQVIFPDKIRINQHYIDDYRFLNDLVYIWQTVFGGGSPVLPEEAQPLEAPKPHSQPGSDLRRAA